MGGGDLGLSWGFRAFVGRISGIHDGEDFELERVKKRHFEVGNWLWRKVWGFEGVGGFFFLEWEWAAGFWAGLPGGGGTTGFWAGWGGRILMGWLLDSVAGLGRLGGLGASWAGDWAGRRW